MRVSVWVKLFVLFHMLAITIWAIPNPPSAYMSGRIAWRVQTDSVPHFSQSLNDGLRLFNTSYIKPSFIKYYVMPTGLWQYWDMFAPNPSNIDWYCDADVVYRDGTRKTYEYPRMYTLGIVPKYFSERFRKFYERAHDDSYSWTWPAFAQRVALLSTTNPDNPPIEVFLRRHWLEIQPPGVPQPETYSSYVYFHYVVDQPKLERDLRNGP